MGRTSAQGGSNPLISETATSTEDEISKTRQYETRQDQEVRAGSHDLPRSTGLQASQSREPVTVLTMTDIWACGIDVQQVLLVINYDFPV